jgi:peptidoglycan hydrolase-like protein with peptidoglycan-binding domain
MHKISTFAIAVALGLAWTALPAAADDTLKNKAERTGDKIENKAERTGDKIEDKTERAKDKAEAKGDTMGAKIDRGVDKTKAKAHEVKEKISDKMHHGDMASGDTRGAQQALQAKGYNPGPIDGIYGPRTTAAVRDFQKAEGLKVTGKMDADTRAKLMASSGAGSTPSASPSTTPATPGNPSSVGSPSQAPAPAPQVEKK